MASWILSQQWLFSLIVILLLLNERHTSKYLGGRMSYTLWLMIPTVLFINSISQHISVGNSSEISRYIVTLNNQGAHVGELVSWQVVWLIGALVVAAISIYSTVTNRFQRGLVEFDRNTLSVTLPPSLSVYGSSEVSGPMLVGVFAPKLVLPHNFHQLYSAQQQQLILQHELCHFHRKDNLVNAIAVTGLSMFWFNPLAWLGYRAFRKSQEIACDASVLQRKSTNDRLEYSKALVNCAQSAHHKLCIDSHYTQRNIMFKRINMLKNHNSVNKKAQLTVALLAATFTAGIAVAKPPLPANDSKTIAPEIRIEPRYPIKAAEEGIVGSVVLKYDIMPAGNVMNVSVVKAVPAGIFNKESRRALKQWKYKPSVTGAEDVYVQLNFMLDDSTEKPINLMDGIEKINVD